MSDFSPLHSHGFLPIEISGSSRVTKPEMTLTSFLQQYSSKLTNTSYIKKKNITDTGLKKYTQMKGAVHFSSEVESTVCEYQFTSIAIVIVSTQSELQILYGQFVCSPCKITDKSGKKTKAGRGDQF